MIGLFAHLLHLLKAGPGDIAQVRATQLARHSTVRLPHLRFAGQNGLLHQSMSSKPGIRANATTTSRSLSPDIRIAGSHPLQELAPLLSTRAKLLTDGTEDDSLWEDE